MLRILTLIVLLTVTSSLSFAGIYRCEEAGGQIVFTDNPANLPQGCQAEYVGDLPGMNVIPSSPSSADQGAARGQLQDQSFGEGTSEGADEYDVLKGEAENLVERFLSTRARVYRATGPRSRNKVRLALSEVRAQKGPMLRKVNESTLNRSQKDNIREILANITDD